MENLLFEMAVPTAIERIKLSGKKFSYLYKGEWIEISITDTMRTVARNPKCSFCEAEATRAFVYDNGVRKTIKFFTEKNGELILFTKDHRIPKSKGGKNNLSNYQTACERCNILKGDISKDNKISQLVVEMRSKIKNQRNEIIRLNEQDEQLRIENSLLEQELYEIYSLKLVKFYFSIKKFFSKILKLSKGIDKIAKV